MKRPRNLTLHIPESLKSQAKPLAARSNLSLSDYIVATLAGAVERGDVFEVTVKKK